MYPALDLASIAVASILSAWALHLLYLWYRLCHIPGPFWGAFTSYWDPRNCICGRWTLDLNNLSDQYGDVVRVGPNLLLTSDVHSLLRLSPPKPRYTWEFLYQDHDPKDFLAVPDSLSVDGKDRIANHPPLFASGVLGGLQIEECVDRQCARLVNLIERDFISTAVEYCPMKLAVVVHQFATNVLGDLLWSQLLRVVGQETDTGTPKGRTTKEFSQHLAVCTEATTTAICTTLTHLLASPAAYSRLQAEIDATIFPGSASRSITDAEAQRLPYLQATIKEGRRICPAYTAPFFEKLPGGGDTLSGYRAPGGTEIGPNMVGIMRSKKHWGQDAEVFRPERWLEAEGAASRAMHDTLEVFWTLGRHAPLGRSIMQTVLNKTFHELLRRFDFALLHPLPPWNIRNTGSWIASGPLVRVTSRTDAL